MVIPKEERAQRLSVSLRAPRRGLVLGHFGGCFHGHHEVNKSTRATRTLVPAHYLATRIPGTPDSLSTVVAFLEALSSLVNIIQGHHL